ncbi:conserved hypothetical protein [Bosea sp. EC-HK365B]|nr:conserved hypothetical protein [Bosea sp. EC-HK365B]VXC06047.1 Helix-turn-helix protein [Bosea sp. 127]
MKLADYLRTHDMKPSEFARKVQSSRQNVSRWMLGQAVPRPGDMRRITEATRGQVTANDFYLAEAA